jgi:hypothetical protein
VASTNGTAGSNGKGPRPDKLQDGKVRVAIVGVGNCASSLVQGRYYYADATTVMPRPMTVMVFGVRCRAIASRTTGVSTARPPSLTQDGRTESPRRSGAGALADIRNRPGDVGRLGDADRATDQPRLRFVQLLEGRGAEPADHLAALALRVDHAGQAEDAQVPADQRLREADARRELADGDRSDLRQEADDPQAGLVTEGAVQGAESPQVVLAGGLGGR